MAKSQATKASNSLILNFLAAGERFFFASVSARPLAILRIAIGLMMLQEAVFIYPSLDDLYGPLGFLQASVMGALGTQTAPNYAWFFQNVGVPYATVLQLIYFARIFALGTFIVGFKTRTSTVFLLATQIFFVYSGEMSSYGVDRYFHLLLFILIWMPVGQTFSVDAYLKRRQTGQHSEKLGDLPSSMCALNLRTLQIAILITYIDAGISKSMGTHWWTGEAIWRVLNMPEFQHGNFTWLARVPALAQFLTVGTMALEGFYFIGVWLPYLGFAWILAIIGMHLGIAFAMGLLNFGLTMALVNVAIFLYPRLQVLQATPRIQPKSQSHEDAAHSKTRQTQPA
jgi:hypothetical protein